MPEAEAALRRVTYEETLDDSLRLNEKLAAPVGKPTDRITTVPELFLIQTTTRT